jgi:hypothetical protein
MLNKFYLGKIKMELDRCERVLQSGVPSIGSVSWYVAEDGDICVGELSEVCSCLRGGLYDDVVLDSAEMVFEEKKGVYDGKTISYIIHRTRNRKNDLSVCSICVFEQKEDSRDFLAYLFSTNDLLAFDNFNCFSGNGSLVSERPGLKCIEQIVFCENKVKLAMAFVRSNDARGILDFAIGNAKPELVRDVFINSEYSDHLSKLLKQLDSFNDELKAARKSNDTYKIADISSQKSEVESDIRKVMTECLRNVNPEVFVNKYKAYLWELMDRSHRLLPFANYTKAGKMVLLSSEYLDIWSSIGMMCVLSARMRQLRYSKHERRLVAALVPRCVTEMNPSDDRWAMPLSLDTLAEKDGFKRMMEHVFVETEYQETFISNLRRGIRESNNKLVMDMLFSTDNQRMLGLSERILQALWTKEITFSGRLLRSIRRRMDSYGIEFYYFVPDLVRSSNNDPYKVASSVGRDVSS